MAVEPSHVVPDNEPLFILGNTLEPGFPKPSEDHTSGGFKFLATPRGNGSVTTVWPRTRR